MQDNRVRSFRGPWIAACVLTAGLLGSSAVGSSFSQSDQTINLDDARKLALADNLDLAERALAVRAAAGAAQQTRAWPNPEVGVDGEDFGGDLPKWSDSQTTWSVSQRIDLPFARWARIAAAGSDLRVAALDYERAKLDLLAEVERRFATLLAEQSRLEVAQGNERIADTLLAAVCSLVNAGEASPIEEDRARADRSRASMGVRRAESAIARAQAALVSLWASSESAACRAEGTLEVTPLLPAEESFASLDPDLPDLASWDAVVARREADLRLQRWSRLPGITLGGGARRANGSGDRTWTASVALELPLWDRKGGAITEASARAAQARVGRQAGRLRITTERRVARDALAGSLAEVRIYREFTRLEVRRAYDAVSEGYRRGKFRLIDLLDARRSLAETELGYIDALLDLWSARIDLERLLAQPLNATGGIQR
jgi:outer membrane protein, heavy metal efflux system